VRPLSKLRICGASCALAGAAALFTGGAVHAASQPGNTIEVTVGCTSVNQGVVCTYTFHATLASGADDSGDTVHFTVSGVPGSSVNPTSGVTDPGFISTKFTASATNCGTATITATTITTGATGTATVAVPCNSLVTLPNTSTPAPSAPLWTAGLGGLAVLALVGGGVYLRRARATV
jgi:hypothetical protein